jgi:hypothetical protein
MENQNQSSLSPSFAAGIDPKVKNLAIALCVLAALLLIGVVTKSWFTASERRMEIGMGLTGVELSGGGKSMSMSYGDMGKAAPGGVAFIGYLALIAGLAAAAGAGAFGYFTLTRKPNPIPRKVFDIAVGLAVFGTLSFVLRWFIEGTKGASIGYSAILGIGGAIGVGVVSKMIDKAKA